MEIGSREWCIFERMAQKSSSVFSRRLAIASVFFGLFVLCDILLFAWLIFRSLSQREIDRVLLETRAEAQALAERILAEAREVELSESDLYVIMARQREIQRYIDSDLAEREIVEEVEIFNRAGNLVFRQVARGAPGTLDLPPLEIPLPGSVELPGTESPPAAADEGGFEVAEAIGELGTLRIGLSPAKLHERTALLRQDLIRQMVWIMVVSVLMLLSAYGVIWLLLLRTRRAEEQAREADRLAYIGTLAAGLAHEIRNPLNSLNLNMQMLEEEISAGCEIPSGRRLLGITMQEISRLERLVTDFLLYARPRPAELEEVVPVSLMRRVEEVLAGEIRARGVNVVVVDECDGDRVVVDRGQMTQLLMNLAQNALAATEESPRPGEVVLAVRCEGGKVAFVVEDNGVGIAAEEQERIFEIFYSTRKGGTGLGLAVVERIARTHEGEIRLESVPGEGTRVGVWLPAVPGHPERATA